MGPGVSIPRISDTWRQRGGSQFKARPDKISIRP
jgi:hypothetical protein